MPEAAESERFGITITTAEPEPTTVESVQSETTAAPRSPVLVTPSTPPTTTTSPTSDSVSALRPGGGGGERKEGEGEGEEGGEDGDKKKDPPVPALTARNLNLQRPQLKKRRVTVVDPRTRTARRATVAQRPAHGIASPSSSAESARSQPKETIVGFDTSPRNIQLRGLSLTRNSSPGPRPTPSSPGTHLSPSPGGGHTRSRSTPRSPLSVSSKYHEQASPSSVQKVSRGFDPVRGRPAVLGTGRVSNDAGQDVGSNARSRSGTNRTRVAGRLTVPDRGQEEENEDNRGDTRVVRQLKKTDSSVAVLGRGDSYTSLDPEDQSGGEMSQSPEFSKTLLRGRPKARIAFPPGMAPKPDSTENDANENRSQAYQALPDSGAVSSGPIEDTAVDHVEEAEPVDNSAAIEETTQAIDVGGAGDAQDQPLVQKETYLSPLEAILAANLPENQGQGQDSADDTTGASSYNDATAAVVTGPAAMLQSEDSEVTSSPDFPQPAPLREVSPLAHDSHLMIERKPSYDIAVEGGSNKGMDLLRSSDAEPSTPSTKVDKEMDSTTAGASPTVVVVSQPAPGGGADDHAAKTESGSSVGSTVRTMPRRHGESAEERRARRAKALAAFHFGTQNNEAGEQSSPTPVTTPADLEANNDLVDRATELVRNEEASKAAAGAGVPALTPDRQKRSDDGAASSTAASTTAAANAAEVVLRLQRADHGDLSDSDASVEEEDAFGAAAGSRREESGKAPVVVNASGAAVKVNAFSENDEAKAWEAVSEIQATEQDRPQQMGIQSQDEFNPLVTHQSAYDFFLKANLALQKQQIQPTIKRRGFCAALFAPPSIHKSLISDRDTVFAIAKVAFDNNEPMHERILQTIYMKLTDNRIRCPRYGRHWEMIGFQGQDPATDLRGLGMLSLLHLVYFISVGRETLLDMYRLSQDQSKQFPFVLVSIDMTRIALEALREGSLNKLCNKSRRVYTVVAQCYAATFFQFYNTWRRGGRTLREHFSVTRDELTKSAKKNPGKLINIFTRALSSRDTSVGVATMGDGGSAEFDKFSR